MKILVIPHAPATPLRTRSYEIASALANRGHEVDYLSQRLQPPGLWVVKKITWHMDQLIPGTTKVTDNLTRIYPPAWYRGGFMENVALTAARTFLNGTAYDVVLSAACHRPWPSREAGVFIYDLVDDHEQGLRDAGDLVAAEDASTCVREQMNLANEVICSSLVLQKWIKTKAGKEALCVPNGYSPPDHNVSARAADTEPVVLGYVGGIDEWVNFAPVIESIRKLRNQRDIRLTVVGDGPGRSKIPNEPWITCTGFIAPEKISEQIETFHIGIVPFDLSPLTHAALPLKVLEYASHRRPVISTKLKELELRAFPFAQLTNQDPQDWSEAIMKTLDTSWNDIWIKDLQEFSWLQAAETIEHLAQKRLNK